jgi:hypothetical protein
VKILTIVVMTHGLRGLGKLAGPRWGGLILGLPCSTAIVLFFFGYERGTGYAVRAAESGILGLVAAVTLSLAYSLAIGLRWRLPRALLLAVAAYLAVAGGFSYLAAGGVAGRIGVATLGVLVAAWLARRIQAAGDMGGTIAPSRSRALALRTVVPVVCLMTVLGLKDAVGETWAGLLSTFPSTFLAVLVVTHLEAGPAVASQTARAFPLGNLSMIVFIAAFRLACPLVGLGWATAGGYGAALATLLIVEWITRGMGRTGDPVRSDQAPRESERRLSCPSLSHGIIHSSGGDGDCYTDKVTRSDRRAAMKRIRTAVGVGLIILNLIPGCGESCHFCGSRGAVRCIACDGYGQCFGTVLNCPICEGSGGQACPSCVGSDGRAEGLRGRVRYPASSPRGQATPRIYRRSQPIESEPTA